MPCDPYELTHEYPIAYGVEIIGTASGDDNTLPVATLVPEIHALEVRDATLRNPMIKSCLGFKPQSEFAKYYEDEYKEANHILRNIFEEVYKDRNSTIETLVDKIKSTDGANHFAKALEPYRLLAGNNTRDDSSLISQFAEDVGIYFANTIPQNGFLNRFADGEFAGKFAEEEYFPCFDVLKKSFRSTRVDIEDKTLWENAKTIFGNIRRNCVSTPLSYGIDIVPIWTGAGAQSRADQHSNNSAITESVINALHNAAKTCLPDDSLPISHDYFHRNYANNIWRKNPPTNM